MAIFQQKLERRITLDDTDSVFCFIETSQKVNGHTVRGNTTVSFSYMYIHTRFILIRKILPTQEYVLKFQRGPLKENCWRLQRRYNDFVELNKCLVVSGIQLPFPEKKLFGNMHPDFISKRLLALQDYINAVLMNPILASSLPAKKFVDPETYNQSFLGIYLIFITCVTKH